MAVASTHACLATNYGRYVPQHAHNAACFQLVLAYEQQQRIRYDYFLKVRPDLSFFKPFPPVGELQQLMSAAGRDQAICTVGKYGGPLAGDKPLDDKFGMMGRRVALAYFNATVRRCPVMSVLIAAHT